MCDDGGLGAGDYNDPKHQDYLNIMDLAMKNPSIKKIAINHPEIIDFIEIIDAFDGDGAFEGNVPLGEYIEGVLQNFLNDPEIVGHAMAIPELMHEALKNPKIINYAKKNPEVLSLIMGNPKFEGYFD